MRESHVSTLQLTSGLAQLFIDLQPLIQRSAAMQRLRRTELQRLLLGGAHTQRISHTAGFAYMARTEQRAPVAGKSAATLTPVQPGTAVLALGAVFSSKQNKVLKGGNHREVDLTSSSSTAIAAASHRATSSRLFNGFVPPCQTTC